MNSVLVCEYFSQSRTNIDTKLCIYFTIVNAKCKSNSHIYSDETPRLPYMIYI